MLEEKRRSQKVGDKKKIQKEVRVQDLLSILENTQKIARNSMFNSESNDSYLKEFIKVLQPIKTLSMREFTYMVSSVIESKNSDKTIEPTFEEVSNYSNEDIRDMCKNPESVTKAILEVIGHEKFGLSQALLRGSNKEKVIQLILSALDNMEILDAIANKARE